MASLLSFFTGKAGLLIIIFLAGMGAGAWGIGFVRNAGDASALRKVGIAQAKAMIAVVQQSGQREMNYALNAGAERSQAADTVKILQDAMHGSAEAQAAADARAIRLQADIKAKSAQYAKLLEATAHADATAKSWLDSDLPADVSCVRYNDAGCKADRFAKAGYPAPPDRPGAVAQPPK